GAAFVKSAVDSVFVYECIQPGNAPCGQNDELHGPIPDAVIHPVEDASAQPRKRHHSQVVELINIEPLAERTEKLRLDAFERVRVFSPRDDLAPIEPPANRKAKDHNDGRDNEERSDSANSKRSEVERESAAFKERLEPRPGGRPHKAEQRRKN